MKIHPNERTLGKLVDQLESDRGRRVLGHVLECDDCRRRLHDLLRWSGPRPSPELPWTPRAYGAMLDRLVEASAALGTPLTHQQVEAPVLLAELLLHPVKRRRILLRNGRRFHSWPLAELLFDRSREEAFEDPAQAESLARLGLEVAEHLVDAGHEADVVADLRARGLAQLANALRMRSDLRTAEELFAEARECLDRGTGDPYEAARLLELEASLRKDQLRFREALDLLGRAVGKYRSVGESHRARRAILKQAVVHRESGDPAEAIGVLRGVLDSFDPRDEPRLSLCAHHNLATWLADLERPMEAYKVMQEAAELYERFPDPWTQRRRAWVEGRILLQLGQDEEAERQLLAAQRGFVAQEIAYDAALVSLDLAAVYARQGRTRDLRRVAAEMVPVFRARDVHREALAALAFFRRAVEMEAATAGVVEQVLDYLRRARHDPSARFEQPAAD